MDATDRLVAAIFAAMMSAKQDSPTLAEFWGHYDSCLKVATEREQADAAAEQDRVDRRLMGLGPQPAGGPRANGGRPA